MYCCVLINKMFFAMDKSFEMTFLNQACTGLWLACAWFLEIVPVRMSVCVFVYVCVSTTEAINNYWRDVA